MALSTGLTGLLKSSSTALIGSSVHGFACELAAIVRLDCLRLSAPTHDDVQDTHHVFPFECREHAQLTAVKQVLCHEVRAT